MLDSEIIKNLVKKYDLKLLLLFGSRADDTYHEKSDFDIAYLSSRNLNLNDESQLIVDLAPLFKSEQIDLVNLKTAPPLLYYAIFQKPKILHEGAPLLFASLRVYAFKKYIEAKPLYQEKARRVQRSLNS